MIDPNMWAAAAKVGSDAIGQTMGGANKSQAMASLGGNINFGPSKAQTQSNAIIMVAIALVVVMALKKGR